MTIFRGIIFLISGGEWINAHEMSDTFKAFPRAVLFGLPVLSWIAIAVAAGFVVLVGERRSAGPSSRSAATPACGSLYRHRCRPHPMLPPMCFPGALAGLTGYLWVARYAVAYVDIAAGFELKWSPPA
jgi:rhamnose transport system permease protein